MEGKKVAEHQDRLDDELINSDDAGEMEESEVVAGSDARDSIVGRYRQFEKEELKRQGYTEDEIKLMVGTEDESEDEEKKPDDADAKEGDEDVSEDEEKEPEGEKKTEPDGGDAGKAEAEHEPEPDREPDRRELTVEEILPVKVKVKVNGQESEVTVAELQKNYQIAGHLTQQLQQVAAMRGQVEVAAAELERRKQEIEQEYTNLEERIFSEEEIAQRKRDRSKKADDQRNALAQQWMYCKGVLLSRHADADTLDYDPEFNEFRQKVAPFINEQLLKEHGPSVFFPMWDMVLQHYKDFRSLWGALQQANNATTSFKKEREEVLNRRESEQRAQKKKAADVKPSTRGEDISEGDDEDTGDSKEYTRKMARDRLRKQGLA